ncbi:TPA: hypothetical protein SBJ50_002978 [Yersinia enterocolitica]|nr:hypothetical protein [Yersinia enterocolitica]HEF8856160.1 hypothetical protein [Yersinia enterocolitica]HEN3228563.1 hypothetical protein [Yersinia enterocolitica]HEN3381415.1 hypothetical protein [Yersinia enterocolitica]HEN3529149.1 hypothetical protein [Yersinia enterocolitica]
MSEIPQSICIFCFLMLNKGETYAHQKCIDKAAKEEADDKQATEPS